MSNVLLLKDIKLSITHFFTDVFFLLEQNKLYGHQGSELSQSLTSRNMEWRCLYLEVELVIANI